MWSAKHGLSEFWSCGKASEGLSGRLPWPLRPLSLPRPALCSIPVFLSQAQIQIGRTRCSKAGSSRRQRAWVASGSMEMSSCCLGARFAIEAVLVCSLHWWFFEVLRGFDRHHFVSVYALTLPQAGKCSSLSDIDHAASWSVPKCASVMIDA